MKKRSLIAKCLTLAMVFALMVPVPVAAKSAKGGKLVKSVTEYTYQESSGRWKATSKENFKYDKKKNPVTFETIYYNEYFLGVPVSGTKTVTTAKYKYKGKSPKSMKQKDGAGKVIETRKYKKGRVVSITSSKKTSTEAKDEVTGAFKGDNIKSGSSVTKIAYNKKGLIKSETISSANSETYVDASQSNSSNGTDVYTYAVTHKKGIPSYILSNYSYIDTYTDPTVTRSYQQNADGTWTSIYNGVPESGKDDTITNRYTKFNKNGLAIEYGYIETVTATGAQTVFPQYKFVYKSKKGKVSQAIIYDLDTDPTTGVVKKETPETMYKFKYNKTKISKARYFKMVNDEMDYGNVEFYWY